MKRVHTGLLTAILLLSSICFQSCQPQGGEVGPQGATGAQGSASPQGSAGPAGTANVQYSPWTAVTLTLTYNGFSYRADVDAPNLTQDVLDKADIRAYWKVISATNGTVSVYSLPYESGDNKITPNFTIGRIYLNASYPKSGHFRYVIIPGSTSINGRKAAIDYTDYEAVKRAYNLPD